MAKNDGHASGQHRVIAHNRKARYNYEIDDVFEAGLVLHGTEVKSLREGKANIAESYASTEGGEIFLINSYIAEYSSGNRFNHSPRRRRKLLMHRKEIDKLAAAVQRGGMTIVPLKLFFNSHGRVKIQVGLARGKKLHDKRRSEKDRSWQRDKARLMREKG